MNKKRIIKVLVGLVLLFFLGSFIHKTLLVGTEIRFSPFSIYGFHAISTLLVYIMVEIMIIKQPYQTGYLYLGTMMLKLAVFTFLFKEVLFSEVSLTSSENLLLILPLIIFLIFEAIVVSKILNTEVFKV